MKILLFGIVGQVGWELHRSLQIFGEVIALGIEEADFSEPESLRGIVQDINPDIICNAVAYTAVDKAEAEEEVALKINGAAPGVLAEEALKIGALLVHYSTDYVFDGEKSGSYVETDKPNPVNAYGRTKLAGEIAVQSSGCDYLIFRTSWVYASRAKNFMLTMLRLAQEREQLSVVSDQIGAPTSARLIADTTLVCIQKALFEKQNQRFSSDLYHLTASGNTSWHGFTQKIIQVAKRNLGLHFTIKNVIEIPTTDYPTSARRPMNSQLALTKLENAYGVIMPSWQRTLELCVEELK